MQVTPIITRSLGISLFLLFVSCGEEDKKQGEEEINGKFSGPGSIGTIAISTTVDLSDALGVLVVENDTAALNLTASELPSPLQKIIEETGEIVDALKQEDVTPEEYHGPPPQKLPNIMTIALAPTGEVYLHFERGFIYRDAPQDADPWDYSNGYQCQIFKVKGGTIEELLAKTPEKNNLECLDNAHFIDNWRNTSNNVFQFDADGNVYFPASNPQNGKMVVYKRTRDGSNTTEVINANICIEDYLVTKTGGVFYTGHTCQDKSGGNGTGGFFRYVNPTGQVTEIARDWWNFIFDTKVETNDSGSSDTAVFFGPDPRQSTTASWNSACLFDFDPTGSTPSTRIGEVITCGNDIWRWMDMRRTNDVTSYGEGFNNYTGTDQFFSPSLAWKTEYKQRCESSDHVFAGGGSQISSIKQDSTGQVYVIGNIRRKIAGTLYCNVEIRGPHCVIDGLPVITYTSGSTSETLDTQTKCNNRNGTWVDKGYCSTNLTQSADCLNYDRTWNATTNVCSNTTYTNKENCTPEWRTESIWYQNVTGALCTSSETGSRATWWDWDHKNNVFAKYESTTASAKTTLSAKFLVRNFSCSPQSTSSSGDEWTNETRSLARVDSSRATLIPLSTDNEQAINLWIAGDQPYYSSFDTSSGKYLLSGLASSGTCVNSSVSSESSCSGTSKTWEGSRCIDGNYTTQTTCEAASLLWLPVNPYTIMEDFEVYNLAEGASSTELFADGLDFTTNQYKFGTIDTTTKSLTLKTGLTGTVRTIVIFPK
ncbi:MAG: hypothetical protein HYW48_11475 [Deltaproteobacteria bacterium]|nr:hypothetical protein [Deltaproteobacteria bacterium]